MSAPVASLQRTRKAISAAQAFESAGQDHIFRTGGDQDKPKVPIPKGKAIPKRPQQQSSAGNNPAGNGYPGGQPQRPGTHPAPYAGGQYRPPGLPPYQPDAYGNPPPGHQRRAESADYYANHPLGFQAQGGHFAAPPGASQPYAPPQQQQQRSMDPYSPPSQYSQPGFQPATRAYSMPNSNYQPNQYPHQTPSYQQQPVFPQSMLSWPQTAEPATIASSSNPQQGDCPECGGVQRFLHPTLGICSDCQRYRSNGR